MARKQKPRPAPSIWPFRIIAAGIFLAEVTVLRGAASPFRLPKDAIALAAICLAVGVAVAASARRGSIALPQGRLVFLLLVLPIVQAVSALWSADPRRAVESSLFSLIWVAGILWLATLDSRSRLRLATIAGVGVGISAAVMVLQVGGIQVFDLGRGFESGRPSLTGLTGNPADLAMAAVLLLPLLLVKREDLSLSRIQIALVLGLSLATLLTRTQTGVGALVLLLIVWLVQHRSRGLWVRAAAVGTILLVIALATGLGARIFQGVKRAQKGDWYLVLSARGDGWSAASEMVRARPISGVGAANYDHLYYPSRLDWFERQGGVGKRPELASHFGWAHSDPLQLASELGGVGLLWMTGLLVAFAGVRNRAGPVFALAAAAVTPFVLLHYPTHLAVGLIPIALLLGEIIGTTETIQQTDWRKARTPVAALLVTIAIVGAGWQLRRIAADLWMGNLDMVILVSQNAAPAVSAQRMAAIESAVLSRIDRMPRQEPTLWRTVGRTRFMRKDFRGAEEAFRTAFDGWPHEDAEFYLGLALVAQGRRNEGLQHLARVCRTNPTLVRLISDPDLRRSVEDILEAYRVR